MIKRLKKFRQSKQGAILIMVVLILALAMIFIASAMMLTQATRGRLYKNAVSSQARLTVTTAAEVFLEAVETQEITDAQLDAMLDASHTGMQHHVDRNDRMKMIVDGVPGMKGVEGNCTYLDLYYPNTSNHNTVYADFTTVIDDDVENVRAVLKINEQKSNVGGRFSNQIEIAANVGTSELRFTEGVGMYNPAVYPTSPSDNTILMRSSAMSEATSGAIFFSDMVYGGGSGGLVTHIGGGNYYHGDMVFMENTYFGTRSGFNALDGDLYFLGDSNDSSFRFAYAAGWGDISSSNIYFQGKMVHETEDESSPLIYQGRTAQRASDYDSMQGTTSHEEDSGYVRKLFTKDDGSSTGKAYFVTSEGKAVAVADVKATGDAKSTMNLTGVTTAGTYNVSNNANGMTGTVSSKVAYYNDIDGEGYKVGTFPDSAETVFSEVKLGSFVASTEVTLEVDTTSPDGSKTYEAGTAIPAGEPFIAPLTTTFPSYATKTVLNLNTECSGTSKLKILEPGFYYITGGEEDVQYWANGGMQSDTWVWPVKTGKTPYVFAIDGSRASEYRFYFEGGKKFCLSGVIFAVYNAQNDKNNQSAIFVLEPGAEVTLGHTDTKLETSDHVLCTSGFISINRKASAEDLYTYIMGHSYYDECIAYDTKFHKNASEPDNINHSDVIKWSSYYNSKNRPVIFIYGAGGNKLKSADSSIIEAYVGLYGGSCYGIAEGTSTIVPIYGRIEATNFENGYSGGDHPLGKVQMPYCPKPKTDDKKPAKRTAGSKYSVYDVVYFYE